LGEVLRNTTTLNASMVVAGEDGVHWKAVRAAAGLMKFLSENTPRSQGNFNFSATPMLPENTPFYPGSYHTGAGRQFGIALQSANVVAEAFSSTKEPAVAAKALETALGRHARALEATALRPEEETGCSYTGIHLSPAPRRQVAIGTSMPNPSG